MILPQQYYRRLETMTKRFYALPWQLKLQGGWAERLVWHLPEDEQKKVRRLMERAADDTGMLDGRRLSESERQFVLTHLAEGRARWHGIDPLAGDAADDVVTPEGKNG
jgi:hypothetical protein